MNNFINTFKNLRFINTYLCAIASALFFIVFYPVLARLINVWITNEDYSHGFFIVPIAIYIVRQKWKTLNTIPIHGSKTGFAITLFSICLYIISTIGMIETLQSISMIVFIGGSIFYLFGYKIFIELLFPIFVLCFMVPVPSQIMSAMTIHLQLFVTAVSSNLMLFWGISVFREGNLIHLPEKTLQVVAACSGMRSLFALLTLSALFSYFALRSNILRFILFISGIPVAIFVNIIRVSLMIICIYYLNIDLSHGPIHTFFGLCIFLMAIFFLYLIKCIAEKWDKH